ncbi:MAG: hypothetical protein V4736_14615 [Bdellovibrionota bacterium]
MSKFSRRDVLKTINLSVLGSALSPANLFATSFIQGLVSQANAQITGTDPRALITIRAPGGPQRWGFDGMLNPNGETLLPNPYIASHFGAVGGRLSEPIYGTIKYNGITVPHLWSYSVPTVGGGLRPMTDLLNNMMVLRGIDVVDGGHAGAQKKQYMVPGASASIHGTHADVSMKSPLSSVWASGGNGADFQSRRSLQKIDLYVGYNANQNFIADIMAPFKVNNTVATRALALANDASIQAAYASLNTVKSDLGSTLRANVKGADDIVRSGIEDLSTVWVALKTKYANLIKAALVGNYPGLNDMPVGGTTRDGQYNFDQGTNKIVTLDDMRTMFHAGTGMGRTAEMFACAEFMITRGYTNSMCIDIGTLSDLKFDKTDLARSENDNYDSHFIGRMTSTFLWGMTVPCFAACMLEFIDVLKSKTRYDGRNLWNESVIHFGGEFNRTAPWYAADTNPGTGTDHGPGSSVFSHWSGAIRGPIVVGNIIDKNRSDYYVAREPGTVGLGAKIPELNNRIAGTGDMLNSLASLLRVPPPNPNNMSLVASDGTSLIGPPKIVPRAEG